MGENNFVSDVTEEKIKNMVELFTNSNDRKKINYDFLFKLAVQQIKGETIAYLKDNSYRFEYIFSFLCILTMYLNLIDSEGEISISDIEIGTRVIYKDKYYIYKGKSGRNSNFVVLEESNKKKNKLTTEIGKSNFGSIMIADNNKQRSLKNYRKKVAKKLNVVNPCMNNRRKVLILMPKNSAIEFLKRKVKISSGVGLGKILSGGYLNDLEEIETMTGLGHAETNYVVFSSNLFATNEYLINNQKAEFSSVYVFGNSFVTETKINDFLALISICKKKKISFSFFGDFALFLTENVSKNFTLFDNIIFNKKLSEQGNSVRFDKIVLPLDSEKKINELDKLISDLNDNQTDFVLQGLLLKFRQSFFGGTVPEKLENLSDLVFENFHQHSAFSKHQVEGIFKGLIEVDSFNLIQTYIRKYIDNFESILVVVRKDILDDYKMAFKNQAFIHFASYDMEFSKSYPNATSMILISPNKKQRRKWLYSEIYKKGIIIYFDHVEDSQFISLRSDVRVLRKMESFSGVSKIWQLPFIKQYLERKNTNKSANEAGNEKQQTDLDSFLPNNVNSQIENLVQDKLVNNLADVVSVVRLTNDSNIYGTEFGEILVIKENVLHRERIKNLKPGDVVFETRTPYSDVLYREHFSRCYFKDKEPKNIDERLDFYWKSKFIDYISANDVSAYKAKELFEKIDYQKSIGFFQSWIEINRMPMLPHDVEFVISIGRVINDSEIIRNAKKYYIASKNVKEYFSTKRGEYLSSLDNSDVDELEDRIGIKAKKEKVITNKKNLIKGFSRDRTNKLILG